MPPAHVARLGLCENVVNSSVIVGSLHTRTTPLCLKRFIVKAVLQRGFCGSVGKDVCHTDTPQSRYASARAEKRLFVHTERRLLLLPDVCTGDAAFGGRAECVVGIASVGDSLSGALLLDATKNDATFLELTLEELHLTDRDFL